MKKWFLSLLAFTAILMFGFQAYAAVTISNRVITNIGHKQLIYFDLDFDSSYPAGGEALYTNTIGVTAIDQVMIQGKDGYTFEYDTTNQKIKAFSSAPPIVYNEKHTSTSLATGYSGFYLDYPAAWIIAVQVDACNSAEDCGSAAEIINTGTATASLSYSQVCLYEDIADMTRTAIVVGYTAAEDYRVTYVTQAWHDIYNLLVQSETVNLTTTTGIITTTYTPMVLGPVVNIGGFSHQYTSLLPCPARDTYAEGYIAFTPMTQSSSAGAFSPYHALLAAGYTATVTYLKAPTSGWIYDRVVRNEVPSTAVDSGAYSRVLFDFPVLIPGVAGYVMAYSIDGGATSIPMYANYTGISADIGQYVGAAVCSPFLYTEATGVQPDCGHGWAYYGKGKDPSNNYYIKGYPWEIPNLRHLEVKNETDLSGVTGVKVFVIGR